MSEPGTFSMTLNSPLTDEDWAKITDVNMEHTERITFVTPSGREVPFVKEREKAQKNAVLLDRLMPCPFCGSKDSATGLCRPLPDFEDEGKNWQIVCRNCKTNFITPKLQKGQLIEFWNGRADT